MISWATIQTWNPGPLNEASGTCRHRAGQMRSVIGDLEGAQMTLKSEGNTADAARRSLGEHLTTANTLMQKLNGLEQALSGAAAAVGQLNGQVRACHTFATTTGMVIAPTGTVTIGPVVTASAMAQQAAMMLPTHTATPAWIKGMADQATLTGMVNAAVARAAAIDGQLAGQLGASGSVPVTTSANGQGAPIQLMSNSMDLSDELGDSGSRDGKDGPQLPLNESDYWNPPKPKNEVNVDTKMGADESFPPKDFKLEPNTAYTVNQGGKDPMLRGTYYTDDNGVITHVDANASREKGGPLNYDLREPAPNTTYRVMNERGEGSSTYITDDLGRTETAVIDNLDDLKGARHSSIQSSVGHLGSYENGDKSTGNKVYDYNGGHVVAASFGGIREEINLTPQLADVNQANSNADAEKNGPNYGRLENMWREDVSAGREVDVVVRHVYDADEQAKHSLVEQVPTTYMVDYSVDGEVKSTFVLSNLP